MYKYIKLFANDLQIFLIELQYYFEQVINLKF